MNAKELDFEELVPYLRAYVDSYNASVRRYNDPDEHAKDREHAFQTRRELDRRLGNDIFTERLAAAGLARKPYELAEWATEAAELGRQPVLTNAQLKNRKDAFELVNEQRRMLIQFLLDSEHNLPPNLAINLAAALNELNFGEVLLIVTPYQMKGLPKNRKRPAVQLARFARIAYYHGYRGCTLEEVLRTENDALGNLSADVMNKTISRLGCRHFVDEQYQKGKDDRLAGRPGHLDLASDYDLNQLTEILRRS